MVVGFDLSARLVEIAREREADSPLLIGYLVGDAGSSDALREFDGAPFDAVVCSMGRSAPPPGHRRPAIAQAQHQVHAYSDLSSTGLK